MFSSCKFTTPEIWCIRTRAVTLGMSARKRQPELIAEVLEDFLPYYHHRRMDQSLDFFTCVASLLTDASAIKAGEMCGFRIGRRDPTAENPT